MQSSATEDAAATAAEASKDASGTQLQMFREQQASMQPWLTSGSNALDRLNAMMGLPKYQSGNALVPGGGTAPVAPTKPTFNSNVSEFITPPDPDTGYGGVRNPAYADSASQMEKYNADWADYTRKMAEYNAKGGGLVPATQPATQTQSQDWRSLMDPGYEFRKQEGVNALAAAGAASGNYGSGNMGVALQDFGQNLASQEFQNVYNRLAGMSGTGQVQSQQMGNLGVQTGNVMANYLNQAGQNIAQGQVAGANAMAGGVRDLEKGIASYYMYKQPAADYISQDQFNALWV
jgi:hypothetical protein